MAKEYLTTFEAAKIMLVTPDAVLKWIKSGILKARRTPGGHNRISKKSIEELLQKSQKDRRSEHKKELYPYCWEFNEQFKSCPDECEDCLVYKINAKDCYKVFDFPSDFGHLKLNCDTACEECNYYKYIHTDN